MAIETVKMFYKKIESDGVLQEKLRVLQGALEEEKITRLVNIAKEEGFEFSEVEFKSYVQSVITNSGENDELDEGALDQVSGGGIADWIIVSICSFGIMCAISGSQRKKDTCGLDHPNPPIM